MYNKGGCKLIIIRDFLEFKNKYNLNCNNSNPEHLKQLQDPREHIAFITLAHEMNVFTNQTFSFIPFYPCLNNWKKNVEYWMDRGYENMKFAGFTKDVKLSKKEALAMINTYAIIINDPSQEKHLKYSYRFYIKKELHKDARKLFNKANKFKKSYFIKTFKKDTAEHILEKIWKLRNKQNIINSDTFKNRIDETIQEINEYFDPIIPNFWIPQADPWP